MLKNAYLLAKIGADTAENEQHFAEILPIGRRVADRCPAAREARGSDHQEDRRGRDVRHGQPQVQRPGWLPRTFGSSPNLMN